MTPPGVVFFTDRMPAEELASFAQRLETLGLGALWVPELLGREPIATAAFLLARTTTLRVVTGIANVYARDALAAAQARHTLAELSGGRFALGLGVSHPPMAEMRGAVWEKPVAKLRGYLQVIAATKVRSPSAAEPAPVWIAAHGPALLRLAAELADGANTYLMPLEHTRTARSILGPEKTLNVVQTCCLCDDPESARGVARRALAMYMTLPAYQRRWSALGFDASDFQNGGSDQLIDALVAWGSEKEIRERLDAQLDAGASELAIVPLNPEAPSEPAWPLLEALGSVG
jgi:probable F420-dependent oxidoreductase